MSAALLGSARNVEEEKQEGEEEREEEPYREHFHGGSTAPITLILLV